MKKTLLIILVSLFCIAFVMTVFAKTKPVRMEFTGEVASVDEVAQTISVKGPEGTEMFYVAEAFFDEYYGIEVIQPGDVLVIEFEEKEGKKVAASVMLKPGTLTPETSPSDTDKSVK